MVYASIIQNLITKTSERNGFGRVLDKVKVLTATEGKITVEMKVSSDHVNPMGTMHGGFAATLVDTISSYAMLTHSKLSHRLNNDSVPSSGMSVDMHISCFVTGLFGIAAASSFRMILSSPTDQLIGDVPMHTIYQSEKPLDDHPIRFIPTAVQHSYLRAAKIGDDILVHGNTIKTGRTLAFLEVLICNKETGDVLVKGSHTKYIA